MPIFIRAQFGNRMENVCMKEAHGSILWELSGSISIIFFSFQLYLYSYVVSLVCRTYKHCTSHRHKHIHTHIPLGFLMAIQTNERYSIDESVYVPLKNGRIIMQAGRLNNERKPEQMPNKIKIKIKTNENDKIQIQHYQHTLIHMLSMAIGQKGPFSLIHS